MMKNDKVEDKMTEYVQIVEQVKQEVAKVIKGKDEVIDKVFMTILAGGHVLMEDIPGVGKTTLAVAFAKTMMLHYQRVQFTPDVLPSDLVGFSMLNKEQELEYKPGAVMCNIFLADEINRTSPKTQSALLEVMEEGTVTVDGNTWKLPEPFFVIATQNPISSIGTQMLPESQLDRFMVKLSMGYPSVEQEILMLKQRHGQNPLDQVQSLISVETLMEMQKQAEKTFVDDAVYQYIASLVDATRNHPSIQVGVSPRGTLSIVAMAKASAFMNGREFLTPEDVERIFVDVTAHRIVLHTKAKMAHKQEGEILQEILSSVAKPQWKRKGV